MVEMGGLGPAPFAAMTLAGLGADVVRIDRPSATGREPPVDLMNRGKRRLSIDLKSVEGRAVALELVEQADVLVEGARPGVLERLGLGPDECLLRNPRLVYGRMTGWGQTGPLAQVGGHDINYVALTGALHAIGPAQGPPVVPLNLVGNFGAGAWPLTAGLVAALFESRTSGRGQVVDAAIVDGVAYNLSSIHEMLGSGDWTEARAANLIDGAAPFYTVYRASDGGYLAVGAIERKFYANLLRGLGIAADLDRQHDRSTWSAMRARMADRFAERTRDEWAETFVELDACVSPVLSFSEAARHPQMRARATFPADGALRAEIAPRFSRTAGDRLVEPRHEDVETVLDDWRQPRPDGHHDQEERT